MRLRSTTTAEQLRSVSGRYRWPGRRGYSGGQAKRCWPWRRDAPRGAAAESLGPEQADSKLRRLEAVLFLAREPLSSRKLSLYANLADGTEARTLVRRLKQLYQQSGRAFTVEEVAGGFQLLSRPRFAPWLRRLNHAPSEIRLSAPAMETLSVVAYRQPVTRAVMEAIRGVGCGEILRQLMDRDLVRISGRSDELGRPYLYSTTKRFMQLFGLKSLDHLPRAEALFGVSTSGYGGGATSQVEKSFVPQHEQPTEESPVSVCTPSPLLIDEALDEEVQPIAVDAARQSADEDDECDDEDGDEEDEDEDGDDEDGDEYYEDDEDDDDEDDDDDDEEEELDEADDDDLEEDDLEEDDLEEDDLEEDDLEEDDLEEDDLEDDGIEEEEWQEVDDDDEDDEEWDDDDDDLDWEDEDEEEDWE